MRLFNGFCEDGMHDERVHEAEHNLHTPRYSFFKAESVIGEKCQQSSHFLLQAEHFHAWSLPTT